MQLARLALAFLFGVSGAAGAAEINYNADKSQVAFADLDMTKIAGEDAIGDNKGIGPYRFAIGRELAVNPAGYGTWSNKADGNLVWRFDIVTNDAAHLNFGFNPFHLPPGAKLSIHSRDGKTALRTLTDADNLSTGQWWTEVLLSPDAVLELTVPPAVREDVRLTLVKVGHGYRGFGATAKHCKAGQCMMDVACLGAGDPWNDQRRAAAGYSLGATDQCSGSLVNNTANDRRLLFATAGHCAVTDNSVAATVVAYWNYESPTCRTPGTTNNGTALPKPNTTYNGATFRMRTGSTSTADFSLIEFVQPMNPAYNHYWGGWDRRDQAHNCAAPGDPTSTSGLCATIHHPGVDEKRITFVEANMAISGYGTPTGTTHLHPFWDPTPPILPGIQPPPASLPPGVTLGGSSGSPLYNADHRLVGVLSGGPSACGSTGADLSDYYGRLAMAWEGGGTAATAAKSWLDPVGGGTAQFIDGINACTQPAAPTNITASATGPNQINVSWTATAGVTKYRVLRSDGTCPGTTYAQVAEVDNVTSYVDTTVSGGSTYSYKVTSVSNEPCESVQSSCSSATATGQCTLAPTFAGATSAASAGTSGCAVNVNWAAAAPNCGGGGQMRFNVFRSTTTPFTPSPANAVATCVTGTTYNDAGVQPLTQYHYIVRAEDSSGSGGGICAGGLSDSNTTVRSATPSGPDTNGFLDDAESGAGAWTVSGSGAGSNFTIVTTQSNSPTHSWFTEAPATPSEHFLTTAAAVAVPNNPTTTFEAYVRYNTEQNYDGGLLEYSLDGGTTWTDILGAQAPVPANANRITVGGYNGTMNANGSFGARTAWHGASNGWRRVVVDMADFLGRNVHFRFRFKTDVSLTAGTDPGFWVDDVHVYYGSACNVPDAIFANGFESTPGR
ncbi:MAG TPA: hypothetical protein VJ724_13480 [Tahibacter sp.]|nr:hypothetical protein [Tahibacter sp.]